LKQAEEDVEEAGDSSARIRPDTLECFGDQSSAFGTFKTDDAMLDEDEVKVFDDW